MEQQLAYQVQLKKPFDEAVETVSEALKGEGFGVLTRIDVKKTLNEKLGEDFRSYVILGACNPPLAHRALTADPRVGILLPCNVTVEQTGSEILISLVNPEGMLSIGGLGENPVIQEVAREANDRIQRVAAYLREL